MMFTRERESNVRGGRSSAPCFIILTLFCSYHLLWVGNIYNTRNAIKTRNSMNINFRRTCIRLMPYLLVPFCWQCCDSCLYEPEIIDTRLMADSFLKLAVKCPSRDAGTINPVYGSGGRSPARMETHLAGLWMQILLSIFWKNKMMLI